MRDLSAIIVRAPLRISFAGGGTDLPAYYVSYGGLVVSAAIDRYCYVVATERSDRSIRIDSADYQVSHVLAPGEVPGVEEPLILPKAVVEWFAARGLLEGGVDLSLASDVPPGTGLGSSSAMAVALIRALTSCAAVPASPAGIAELASRLEIERLGMPIGKQDQYASAFGGINSIRFTADGVAVEPVDIPRRVVRDLASRLMLFSTGRSRRSSEILQQQKIDTGVNPRVTESLHQLKALAGAVLRALTEEDLDRFGRLLDEGWQLKKQLSGKISSAKIDRCYEAARSAGALGGKITGAGGGGFLLLYCPIRQQEAVRSALAAHNLHEMPFAFDFQGAQVVAGGSAIRPSAAVGVLQEPARSTSRMWREVIHVRAQGTNAET